MRDAGHPIDVILVVDVEDIVSPSDLGHDDGIREIAEIPSEEDTTGLFLFIGGSSLQPLENPETT